MRSVVLLGSTGSIGESALRVISCSGETLRVVGLGARSNHGRLLEQAREFGVRTVAISDERAAERARRDAPPGVEILSGERAPCDLAARPEADIVLCALVGLSGLEPTLAALAAGHDVALATKEVLVAAGELVMRERARRALRILPVDSEHSAIFQCLESRGIPGCVRDAGVPEEAFPERKIRRLILTASGGPFGARPGVDLAGVSVEEALDHPRWDMGPKVSIDSATMMNKGLEILEAAWLFGVSQDRIDVIVHPESVVHSLVEFEEGASLAQVSPPDMRLPIHYALHWPAGRPSPLPDLDLAEIGALHFRRPDPRRFPCLRLAREAAAGGGTLPAAMNAANEVAVAAFLSGRLRFCEIAGIIEQALAAHPWTAADSLDAILDADRRARALAARLCQRYNKDS